MKSTSNRYVESTQDYVVIPPDGGWGWIVVIAAFYCNMIIDGIQLCFGMILPEMAKDYNTDYANISLIGSLMYGMHLFSGPLCAALCHRFGERVMAIIGSIMTCIVLALGYFRPPYPVFYLTLGIIGGTGLCFVNMTSIVITSLYFSKRRAIAVGIVVGGTGAGTIVFALGANAILRYLSWTEVLLCEAIMSLSMIVAVLTYRPLKPQPIPMSDSRLSHHTLRHEPENVYYGSDEVVIHSSASILEVTADVLEQFATQVAFTEINEEDQGPVSDKPKNVISRLFCCFRPKQSPRCKWKPSKRFYKDILINLKDTMKTMIDFKILKSCSFVTFCIAGALASTGLVIVFFYEKARMLHEGHSDDDATNFVALLGASTMIWRLILGVVALLPRVNVHALNIIGLCVGGVAVTFSGIYKENYFFYIWGLLYGLATGCFSVFFPVILCELISLDKISNATGISMLFMGAFSIIGPPVAGSLQVVFGGFNVVFGVAGAMFFFSGLLYTFITGPSRNLDRPRNVVLH